MWSVFLKRIEKFYSASNNLQDDLSHKWRAHANRRTSMVLTVAFLILVFSYFFVVRAPGRFPTGELVTIPEGASLFEASHILRDAQAVRSAVAFRLLMRVLGKQGSVHAGDYLFKEPADIFTVAKKVAIGAFGLEPTKFFIPEGATTQQMALIFGQSLQRFDKESFLAKALPLEGHLFPDTYFFLPNVTEDTVLNALHDNYQDRLQTIVTGSTTLAELIEQSGLSEKEVVTIASILEREAHNFADRKLIAGVIYNRLERKMPLQMDVTFLYTLGKGTFELTKADLASDSPYNTYRHPGLPPTPIGSPSLESMIAAVTPTKSKFLYFLADHNGVTHYCETWECQKENKAIYF